ncbi:hypothetical protein WDZ92_43115, partial [Nostoc sp. NIES-2111]
MRLLFFCGLALSLGLATAAEPFVDLIHISDTHIANFTGVHPDLAQARASNATSLARFQEFAQSFAQG